MKLTPYRQVAAAANKSWYLGLTNEQIATMTFDELEGNCWASGSMQYAIDYLAKVMNFNDEQKKEFADAVFAKDHVEVDVADKMQFDRAGKRLAEVKDQNAMIIDTLSAIHDGWVKDNAKKFNFVLRDGTRFQHLPIELIGWEEAKLDLLFLQPILEAVGVKVDMAALEKAYNKKVAKYFVHHNLTSTEDLAKLIEKGKDFYAPLSEKNSVKDTFMFDAKTMDFLKAHKKDNRIKNLQYPALKEKENFVKEVQAIVDAIENEEFELFVNNANAVGADVNTIKQEAAKREHLEVGTIDVSKAELAQIVAEQSIAKLPVLESNKIKTETEDK